MFLVDVHVPGSFFSAPVLRTDDPESVKIRYSRNRQDCDITVLLCIHLVQNPLPQNYSFLIGPAQ